MASASPSLLPPGGPPRSSALRVPAGDLAVLAVPDFWRGMALPPPGDLIVPHPQLNTGGVMVRLHVKDELGHGHCWYRCIARQVLGNESLHPLCRKLVSDWIEVEHDSENDSVWRRWHSPLAP
jgi:hypothetical protein